jgi:hypothetical protein
LVSQLNEYSKISQTEIQANKCMQAAKTHAHTSGPSDINQGLKRSAKGEESKRPVVDSQAKADYTALCGLSIQLVRNGWH